MNPIYFDDVCMHFILAFNDLIPFKIWAIKRGAAKIMASLSLESIRGEWSFDIWIKTTYET